MGGQLRTDTDVGEITAGIGQSLTRIYLVVTVWDTIKVEYTLDEMVNKMESGDRIVSW